MSYTSSAQIKNHRWEFTGEGCRAKISRAAAVVWAANFSQIQEAA